MATSNTLPNARINGYNYRTELYHYSFDLSGFYCLLAKNLKDVQAVRHGFPVAATEISPEKDHGAYDCTLIKEPFIILRKLTALNSERGLESYGFVRGRRS